VQATPEGGRAADSAAEGRQSRQSGAAKRILDAAAADRRRFAQDLHEGAQQKFVAAVENLQLARARFVSRPDSAKQHLEAALAEAEAGVHALRELVTGIHPPILSHLGLQAAVGSLVDGFPIPVRLEMTAQRVPPDLEASVYFFVSEGLANVAKHARARAAGVVIAVGERVLTVEVSDDGVGGADPTSGGYGLVGLVDRVQALGGELTVTAQPTGGTMLRGVLPLPSA
jgi:signal transduction histidine kinase